MGQAAAPPIVGRAAALAAAQSGGPTRRRRLRTPVRHELIREAAYLEITWQQADGLVVRLSGIGVDLATLRAAADASRELARAEWVELVESDDDCPAFDP